MVSLKGACSSIAFRSRFPLKFAALNEVLICNGKFAAFHEIRRLQAQAVQNDTFRRPSTDDRCSRCDLLFDVDVVGVEGKFLFVLARAPTTYTSTQTKSNFELCCSYTIMNSKVELDMHQIDGIGHN